ncbi:hypothetical protein PR202_gb25063 [Eleusine coracana subsp. coracana]|uniref:Uncharacterized protein n=1 Tax=Eleusine coracana subsp. coracana TaxID=191504 RepID=A0AAV5FKA0_ELECO|nr:hypothetical protein PR202_gb25063 [Eleusine coracana subsp. coracana]
MPINRQQTPFCRINVSPASLLPNRLANNQPAPSRFAAGASSHGSVGSGSNVNNPPQRPGAPDSYTPASPPFSASSEEVDSDGSLFWTDDNPHNLVAGTWMPQGDMAFASRFAYAFASGQPPQATASFIHDAILAVGCRLRFTMFPSSRGDLLVLFDGPNERDYTVPCSPIKHEGAWLHLQRPEDADNR